MRAAPRYAHANYMRATVQQETASGIRVTESRRGGNWGGVGTEDHSMRSFCCVYCFHKKKRSSQLARVDSKICRLTLLFILLSLLLLLIMTTRLARFTLQKTDSLHFSLALVENQQRKRAREHERKGGREKLSDFCIILIFIYILSILHNARVTTEIVGWQFINT